MTASSISKNVNIENAARVWQHYRVLARHKRMRAKKRMLCIALFFILE
jgi:hypothetical protein